jgi:hypothetical protein
MRSEWRNRVLGALGAAALIGVAAWVLARSAARDKESELALPGLMHGPSTGTGSAQVLHVRASVASTDNPTARIHEMWTVTDTNEVRYYRSNPYEEAVETRSGVTVTSHVTHSYQSSVEARFSRRVAIDENQAMLDIDAEFTIYADLMAEGALTVMEYGTVQGRPAIRVEYTHEGMLEGLEGKQILQSVWLDQASLVPYSEKSFDVTNGPPVELATTTYTYDVIEYVDRTALPARFFELQPPASVTPELDRYMTVSEAQGFAPFAVYWLGQAFNGLPLDTINYQLTASSEKPGGSFAVEYGHDYWQERSNPVGRVSLVQEPASQFQWTGSGEGATVLPPELVEVTVPGGSPTQVNNPVLGQLDAVLYNSDPPHMQLVVGATGITIHARNNQELVDAASALQRLN